MSSSSSPYLIAVHAGAGYHGASKEALYTAAMEAALQAAAMCLDGGGSSMEAVRAAICVLEDAPITNAGRGSNLTLSGSVECDASIMSGEGLQGAVGAVPGVDHPIAAAHLLAVQSQQPLPCGLVPPIFLAGDASRRWAVRQGLAGAATAEQAGQRLVHPTAHAAWQRYCSMLREATGVEQEPVLAAGGGAATQQAAPSRQHHDGPQQQQQQPVPGRADGGGVLQEPPVKRQRCVHSQDSLQGQPESPPPAQVACQAAVAAGAAGAVHDGDVPGWPARLADVADTVGCVVVDAAGRLAAGVSSGGLALKAEGRVGEAAVVGAGVWADGGTAAAAAAPALAAGAEAGDAAGAASLEVPGVAVSVSGVGERVMAASLARAVAMQLQVAPHQPLALLAEGVVRGQLLGQAGPWDAGLIAARVSRSGGRGDGATNSSSSDGSRSSGSEGQGGMAAQAEELGDAGNGGTNVPPQQPQPPPQHQQPMLRVELVAAFSSPSFAVGYLGCTGSDASHSGASVLSEVQVLRCPDTGMPAAPAAPHHGARPAVTAMEVCCTWPAVQAAAAPPLPVPA